MALKSMTGFARASGGDEALSWVWEVKSVNGKGLDARFRLPPGLEALEPLIRKALTERFRRGNFQISLQLSRASTAAALRLNEELLEMLVLEARKLARRLPDAAPLDAAALLAVRGVLEPAEDDRTRMFDLHAEALLASFETAMEELAKTRAAEGARLQEALSAQVNRIEELTKQARDDPARAPEAIRARLKEQVARLMDTGESLDEARLHQEAMIMAARADIAEELDRLDAHVAAARDLLEADGAVGRKLDFLAQEFNREANTLCSKANAASISAAGMELKVVIDQFREQAANIE